MTDLLEGMRYETYPEHSPELSEELGSEYPFQSLVLPLAHRLARIIETDKKYHLTAWMGNRLAGLLTYQKITKKVWGTWNTYVRPEFRGRRLNVKLHEMAFDIAREHGGETAIGSVAITNDSSIRSIKRYFEEFFDIGIRHYAVKQSDYNRLDSTAECHRTAITDEVCSLLYPYYADTMGATWIDYMTDEPMDSLRDFRMQKIGRRMRLVRRANVYFANEQPELGYLVLNQARGQPTATGFFCPGSDNQTDTISLLHRSLRMSLADAHEVYLTVVESPRTGPIDSPVLGKTVLHRIPYIVL